MDVFFVPESHLILRRDWSRSSFANEFSDRIEDCRSLLTNTIVDKNRRNAPRTCPEKKRRCIMEQRTSDAKQKCRTTVSFTFPIENQDRVPLTVPISARYIFHLPPATPKTVVSHEMHHMNHMHHMKIKFLFFPVHLF
jgi:hypothetical protein